MKTVTSNMRIKELIDRLEISQTEFCRIAGINKSALSNYLNGDRLPRQDQISKIADAFNVNPAWLMGYDVPMQTPIDYYDSMIADRIEKKTLEELPAHISMYARLLAAANGCTDEQINIAIETLSAFKKTNKTEG